MRTLVLLTLLGAASGERWKYAGTCYGYFVNYYDFDQDRSIRGNRGNANHRFATDQTTGCFNAVVTGGRGSFSMKFWKDDVQQGGIVATAYGNFANLALTADAVADGWTKTGSTLCPPGAIIDPAWKVQRDAAFEQKKQENLDQAQTTFNQKVQQIQLTREQIFAQKKQEAKQRSCDAFAGRVNGMGHLNAERKQKVIDNFFTRMGCIVAAPVFHCTEGANGACYESDGPHVANYRLYSQDYQGWKSFCASWSSNQGTFNGGVGRC